jgi:hypothetical protein
MIMRVLPTDMVRKCKVAIHRQHVDGQWFLIMKLTSHVTISL